MLKPWIHRWGPAVLMMAVIFAFSARASTELPNFGQWDYFLKKGGHALGYALLALAYWCGLAFERDKGWFAWGLAICYAITDEIHQIFVPGRHPSVLDVLLFDNLGAMVGLNLWEFIGAVLKRRKS